VGLGVSVSVRVGWGVEMREQVVGVLQSQVCGLGCECECACACGVGCGDERASGGGA